MEKYEPFDLKITKLTGLEWQRGNVASLLRQLITEQGKPRYSVENRVIIAFDKSLDSSVEFLQGNRSLLLEVLLNIAYNPYAFTYRLKEYHSWFAITLVRQYRRSADYHEHPIGPGMREPGKAVFETELLREASLRSGGRLRANPETEEHGHDGDLRIDRSKVKNADALGEPAPAFDIVKLYVCDYGAEPVPPWKNCEPCPLFVEGHCQSQGAAIWRALHPPELGTDVPSEKQADTSPHSEIASSPRNELQDLLEHHKKRGTPEGWLWCLGTWHKVGKPTVYAPGGPYYDLSLYLYPERLSPDRRAGIASWLKAQAPAPQA